MRHTAGTTNRSQVDRIRVLWLITGLGGGGAERLLVSTAKVADHSAYAYEVAHLLSWKDALSSELHELGVRVHDLGVRDVRDPRWTVRLRRLLMTGRYDVLHAHSPFPAAVGRMVVATLPPAQRPRLMSTEHNVWDSYSPASRWLNAWTSRLDDVRLAVSDAVRDSMPARSARDVEVVVQGLLLEEVRRALRHREEARTELGVRDGEVLSVTVANLRTEKAYPDLLVAARRVIDSGAPVRFVAVGGGPLERRIRNQKRELGLDDRFQVLGYRSDAMRILAGADLFVLASHHEGFPIALMEALALGVPIVSTAVGGTPIAVTQGTEGLLVPPQRPEELADAILRVVEDPQLRMRMAAAAERRGADFDIRGSVARTQEIYRRLANPER